EAVSGPPGSGDILRSRGASHRASFLNTRPSRGRRTGRTRLQRVGAVKPMPLYLSRRVTSPPEIHYATSGDLRIAYQAFGSGPNLVWVPGWVSQLDLYWEEPALARFLERLASFARVIVFDRRGIGLSDRVRTESLPTLEQRMDDIRAVLDDLGVPAAAVFGQGF